MKDNLTIDRLDDWIYFITINAISTSWFLSRNVLALQTVQERMYGDFSSLQIHWTEIQTVQVLTVIYLNWLVSWVYRPWSRRTIWVTPASFFCTSTFPGWGSQCTYPSSNIILLYIFPIFLLTSSISIPAAFSLINQSIN